MCSAIAYWNNHKCSHTVFAMKSLIWICIYLMKAIICTYVSVCWHFGQIQHLLWKKKQSMFDSKPRGALPERTGGVTIFAPITSVLPFDNVSLELNACPSSNQLASSFMPSLKRTTTVWKRKHRNRKIEALSRGPSSLHSRVSRLIMHDWVAEFCLVRGQTQWGCKIYSFSRLQTEVDERSCLIYALQSASW